jgi:hypothetical protein
LSTFVANFLSSDGRFEKVQHLHGANAPPHLVVTVLDARVLPFAITFLSAGEVKDGAFLCGRDSRIVAGYMAQLGVDPDVHLVDGWFPWGQYTINMLIRLIRSEGGDFSPLSATVVGIL